MGENSSGIIITPFSPSSSDAEVVHKREFKVLCQQIKKKTLFPFSLIRMEKEADCLFANRYIKNKDSCSTRVDKSNYQK